MNTLEKIMKGYEITRENFERAQKLAPGEYDPLSPEYLKLWEEHKPILGEIGTLGEIGGFLCAFVHPLKAYHLIKVVKAYRAENPRNEE